MLDALRAVGAGIDRYRQVAAARLGLGTAELTAISQLHHQEPLRAAQIGARTGLTPGSVTALLDRLESRGYVTRLRPDHDRRTLGLDREPGPRAADARSPRSGSQRRHYQPPLRAIVGAVLLLGARDVIGQLDFVGF